MAQSDMGNMESPLSGSDFINGKLEPWAAAVKSNHSGISRPTYVVAQMIWIDTTTTPWIMKMYDGSNDISLGTINATTDVYTPAGIGSLIQAYNANLAAEAGLTGAADKISYYTGAGAKALTDFTSSARTLLAASTAALQRTALGLGAVATLSAIGMTNANAEMYPYGYANKLRNPTMEIWNRDNVNVSSGTEAYTADGYLVGCSGAGVSTSKQGQFGKSLYSMQITGNTSVSQTYIRPRIESNISANLIGQQVTLTFRFWNANTGVTLTPTLEVNTPTVKDNYGAVTNLFFGQALQGYADGASGICSYTFTCPAGANNGLEFVIYFGSALNSNTKYILLTDFDFRMTPGFTTGLNPYSINPEFRPASIEHAICARYLRNFKIPSASNFYYSVGQNTSATQGIIMLPLGAIPLRNTAPTVSVSSATHFGVTNSGGSGIALTALNHQHTSDTAVCFQYVVASGLTTGHASGFYQSNSAGYIRLSCEL